MSSRLDSDEEYQELLLERERLCQILASETSFYAFVKLAWSQIEGGNPYIDGWHIQVLCEHLEAAFRRQIRDLMIHMPPRCMKSSLIAVLWPAWVWIKAPHEQFLFASYANSLSLRDSVKCRRLISSPFYQNLWGDRFILMGDQNTKGRFENDRSGYRIAASVGSSVTGEGGSILVVDDGNNARDGESEVMRENTNNWYSQVWATRLNNPKTGVRIVVQQRLHENDLSGYILKNDTDNHWTKLILPMEFEPLRRSKTIVLPLSKEAVWEDKREIGELLWPNRIGEKELKQIKTELGSYNYAGQYQQRPSPESGGIIDKTWFKIWKKEYPPKFKFILQSWDTALTAKETSAYSACTTWGIFETIDKIPHVMLLSLWRGRVGYPELLRRALRLSKNYQDVGDKPPIGQQRPHKILVETKVSGYALIDDLNEKGILVGGFNPDKYGDKIQRVHLVTPYIECGRIWLQGNDERLTPESQLLLEMASIFPNGESRDIIDTLTQAILYFNEKGQLTHNLKRGFVPGKYEKQQLPNYSDKNQPIS